MACKNCSKIRCKVFGLVSGKSVSYTEKDYCGSPGAACTVDGYYERDFGNGWNTFGLYLRLLGSVIVARVTGRTIPTNLNY
jgi:hypothetical protein